MLLAWLVCHQRCLKVEIDGIGLGFRYCLLINSFATDLATCLGNQRYGHNPVTPIND